jgi:hypothetical protein
MISYLGRFSVGGLFPTMVSLLAGVVPRLTGQLGGALRISGQVTVGVPSVKARVNALTRIAAQVALQGPSVKFKSTANVNLIALLRAQIALVAAFRAAFGSAGVEAFTFSGPGSSARNEIGDALGSGLPGGSPGEHIDAFVLATRYPSTFSAMAKVFFA